MNSNSDTIEIISNGIESHAAHPDLGVNAISRLMIVLDEIYKKYEEENELLEFFTKYIGLDYNGNILKINNEDETGNLTLNVGRFILENGMLSINMNLRIPVRTKILNKIEQFQNAE